MAITDQERQLTFVLSKRFGYGEALGTEKTPDCYLCDVADQICCSPPVDTGVMTYVERKRQESAQGGDSNTDMINLYNRNIFRRAVVSDTPFIEKMLMFWGNHFSIDDRRYGHHYLNEAILPYVNDSFAKMLSAVIRHPGMIRYLDNNESKGDNSQQALSQPNKKLGLNENLGRELLELHTVGPEQYAHQDIVESSKILSGFTVDFDKGDPVTGGYFDAGAHEPGNKVVMGKTYVEGPEGLGAYLYDLAMHESTANRVIKKLLLYFNVAHDTTDIAALVQIYLDNESSLPPVYRAIMMLPRAMEYDIQTAVMMRTHDYLITTTRHIVATSGSTPMDVDSYTPLRTASWRFLGQEPVRHPTPDGLPVDPEMRAETTDLYTRFLATGLLVRRFADDIRKDIDAYSAKVPIPGAESAISLIKNTPEVKGPNRVAMLYMTAEFQTF